MFVGLGCAFVYHATRILYYVRVLGTIENAHTDAQKTFLAFLYSTQTYYVGRFVGASPFVEEILCIPGAFVSAVGK